MSSPPIVARPDDLLRTAVAKMTAAGVRHVCVVDGEGRALGIVSDRDVRTVLGDPRRALLAGEQPRERLAQLRVAQVMTRDPRTVRDDAPIAAALDALLIERFGALPVVDERERVRGMVSYLDLLRHFAAREHAEPELPTA
jgi:CBS domain-containing protein